MVTAATAAEGAARPSSMTTPDRYLHGHHESVLRSHTWRTVENSAAYLRPHLKHGQSILDIGCGPGTITVELAAIVQPGRVTGVDAAAGVVDQAASLLDTPGAPTNCNFETGDVYALEYPDESFDVVHAHQVLQHLGDPVKALTEMRRVLVKGGLLAVRDVDCGALVWAPAEPLLDRWLELYYAIADEHGTEPNAGRHLLGWARAAGFRSIEPTSSTWTFATHETRTWWGELWADRVQQSSFASHVLQLGLGDQTELGEIARAWRRWAGDEDGWFMCPHGELLARR